THLRRRGRDRRRPHPGVRAGGGCSRRPVAGGTLRRPGEGEQRRGGPRMVAVFLRLRLTQLANSLRRPPVHLIGLAVLLGYAIAATTFAVGAIGDLQASDAESFSHVVTICGSLILFGFLFLPLFFGADDPADPRAAATFGLPAGQVAVGLALSAILSVPAVLLVVAAASQVNVWSEHPEALPVAVLAAGIIVATGVLGARTT